MQPHDSIQESEPPVNTAPLGRYVRWQALLAIVGIALLTGLMGLTAYSVSTEIVPERGGTFREGVAGNPQYINPLLCQTHEVDQDLCRLLFRGLTRLDQNGRVVPDLAEAWTATPDGLSYTFRLRPNQFWHDGEPVTVDDVLFTIEMVQAPDTQVVPDLAELWRSVDVEPVDDMAVRFVLNEPFAPFLDYTTIGLLPRHLWQDVAPSELTSSSLNQTPVGTGRLRVAQISADRVVLEPSPFQGEDVPYISELEFRFYPDYPSIYTAFTEGEIDGISRVLPGDLALAQERDDLQIFSAMESVYLSIVFNLDSADVPFFQDMRVRQALYYATDRSALVDEVANGQGVVAHSPIPANSWAHTDDVQTYLFDPVKARMLLDEAGWIDADGDGVRERDGRPLRFVLLSNDDPGRTAIVERLAASWRDVGVEAVPQSVTFAGLVSDFLVPRRYDAALVTWSITGDPDPYPLWHSSQAGEGGQNYSGWMNEQADTLILAARTTVDREKRRVIYGEFQKIFAQEVPALLLYYPVYTYGVSERVKAVQIGPLNVAADRFTTFDEWYILTRRVPANQMVGEESEATEVP